MALDYEIVERAIDYIEAHHEEQPSLGRIAASVNLSEFHFQRLFSRWVGISPKRFLQYLTKEYAKKLLDGSKNLLDVTFDAGLSSPGRLHDLFIHCEAVTPGEYKTRGQGVKIRYGFAPSPFGICMIATTSRGICALKFVRDMGKKDIAQWLESRWPKACLTRDDDAVQLIAGSVFSFDNQKTQAPIHLFVKGTNFQIKVWEALTHIPFGRTVTYQDIAGFIGNPNAHRAVGTAIGKNPIPLFNSLSPGDQKNGGFRQLRRRKVQEKSTDRLGSRPREQYMTFLNDGKNLISTLDQYHTGSIHKELPVIKQLSIRELHEDLNLAGHLKTGNLTGNLLDDFVHTYLENTTKLHHPGYLAHQVGVPHPTGALGSLIDGFTNNAMAIYEMGPAAAAIEFFMINYLLEKTGWIPMPTQVEKRLTFPHGAGVLTHGGSLANMTALLTARNHLDKTVRENGNPSDLVVLAPESSHYSISKTAGIIGIGEDNVIKLPTDKNGRVLVSKLDHAVETAKKANKRIVALVANACSTGTGLYDPIDDIADFCRENKIWFHVDGAHGASALFSRTHKNLLKGLKKADSFIIDAHKMLRTPTVCASLLVKDAATLDHTFEHTASYLFHEKKQPGFDFIGQVIECTKAGLGLKFFMTLAALGEKKMENYIDTCFDLTKQAYHYIGRQPDFSTPCDPESNILCFRIDASDEDQILIRDHLIEAGQFYLSSTELDGTRYLRIVIISPATSLDDIKTLIHEIREIQAGLC